VYASASQRVVRPENAWRGGKLDSGAWDFRWYIKVIEGEKSQAREGIASRVGHRGTTFPSLPGA